MTCLVDRDFQVIYFFKGCFGYLQSVRVPGYLENKQKVQSGARFHHNQLRHRYIIYILYIHPVKEIVTFHHLISSHPAGWRLLQVAPRARIVPWNVWEVDRWPKVPPGAETETGCPWRRGWKILSQEKGWIFLMEKVGVSSWFYLIYLGVFNLDLCLFLGGWFFLRIGILWDHHFASILVFPVASERSGWIFHGRSL